MAQQLGFDLAVIAPEEHRAIMQRKQCRCLTCSEMFASSGPGHRVCDQCKTLDLWTSPSEFSVAVSAAF